MDNWYSQGETIQCPIQRWRSRAGIATWLRGSNAHPRACSRAIPGWHRRRGVVLRDRWACGDWSFLFDPPPRTFPPGDRMMTRKRTFARWSSALNRVNRFNSGISIGQWITVWDQRNCLCEVGMVATRAAYSDDEGAIVWLVNRREPLHLHAKMIIRPVNDAM